MTNVRDITYSIDFFWTKILSFFIFFSKCWFTFVTRSFCCLCWEILFSFHFFLLGQPFFGSEKLSLMLGISPRSYWKVGNCKYTKLEFHLERLPGNTQFINFDGVSNLLFQLELSLKMILYRAYKFTKIGFSASTKSFLGPSYTGFLLLEKHIKKFQSSSGSYFELFLPRSYKMILLKIFATFTREHQQGSLLHASLLKNKLHHKYFSQTLVKNSHKTFTFSKE